ncbi:TetR/AcrR family transcriptional regulator [Actinophytocola oryzae]|uniref:TetR family transcriptional regulator n=1 Tax=Actinophytocola oryzae TaxID=502181 RepID=A0A4R7US34_9PSEU|nr:TetR/AcrR family transcriptional regulator [Actinophytocola oryzae]TDV36078.1 TetR family transcriptional regulator [Actinophytocola oryzae]
MTTEDHAGDMATTMALLWGTKPAPARGRKPGMTVERIVATAIAIADADGLDALSMRRVADTLGVGTMSLYRYLPGKAELYELMLDTVMGEDAGVAGPATRHWRESLAGVARQSLDGYRRHPWLLEASLSRGMVGPNQAAVLDRLLAVLDGTGLTNGRKMAVVGLVVSYVQGRARQLAEAARTEQRSGRSDLQFWHEFAPLLEPHLSRFPSLASVWRDEELTWEDEFEFGLQRVLDGIEAYIDRETRGNQ